MEVQVLTVYIMTMLITDPVLGASTVRHFIVNNLNGSNTMVASLVEFSTTSGQRNAERRRDENVSHYTSRKSSVEKILYKTNSYMM